MSFPSSWDGDVYTLNSDPLVIIEIYFLSQVFNTVSSDCPSPPEPFANEHNGTEDAVYPPGTTLTYTCLTGFSADDNVKTRVCRSDGSWTETNKICSLSKCLFYSLSPVSIPPNLLSDFTIGLLFVVVVVVVFIFVILFSAFLLS